MKSFIKFNRKVYKHTSEVFVLPAELKIINATAVQYIPMYILQDISHSLIVKLLHVIDQVPIL